MSRDARLARAGCGALLPQLQGASHVVKAPTKTAQPQHKNGMGARKPRTVPLRPGPPRHRLYDVFLRDSTVRGPEPPPMMLVTPDPGARWLAEALWGS